LLAKPLYFNFIANAKGSILSGNRMRPKRSPEIANLLPGLDADDLARSLADDRQPAYPGVEDLAQLIAAA